MCVDCDDQASRAGVAKPFLDAVAEDTATGGQSPAMKRFRHVEQDDDYPLIFANGFRDAILGLSMRAGAHVNAVVYDYDKCIDILVQQGMESDDAQEFLDFNTVGAYVGEATPIFVSRQALTVALDMAGLSEAPDGPFFAASQDVGQAGEADGAG